MSTNLKKSREIVCYFDCSMGNPNGDPDADNRPRQDMATGHGFVTDVCIKHKIRQYIAEKYDGVPGMDIYIQPDKPLNEKDAALAADASLSDNPRIAVCGHYYDVRSFGGVFTGLMKKPTASEKKAGAKQDDRMASLARLRGAVQVSMAVSADKVEAMDVSITRSAVSTRKDWDDGDRNTIGGKYMIPYGLYKFSVFVHAPIANKNGFSEEDYEALIDALKHMFCANRSASSGIMTMRKIVEFEYESAYGADLGGKTAQDLVHAELRNENTIPRGIQDYDIVVEKEGLPPTVTVTER